LLRQSVRIDAPELGGNPMQATASPLASAVVLLAGLLAAAGRPILLFMDGTGGTAESEFISELGFAPLPYIVPSIAPLYSGDRMFGTSNPELLFFNYVNPLAGRTNQLQQAADMIYLRRVVEGIV